MLPRAMLLTLFSAILILAGASTGCKKDAPGKADSGKAKADKGKDDKKDDGWLFAEPGDKYHVKLKVDMAGKKASAWVLDESATEPTKIEADDISVNIKSKPPVQIKLKAQRAKDEKKTSEFAGEHPRFGDKLNPKEIEIAGTIEGKAYTFKLDEEHDHKK